MREGESPLAEDEGVKRFEMWSVHVRHARLVRSGVSSLLVQNNSSTQVDAIYRSRYAVQVSNLHAIDMKRVEGGLNGFRIPVTPPAEGGGHSASLYAQLEKAAVRCLYTLGLDSGEVVLTSCGERKYGVEKVTPSIRLKDIRMQNRYKQVDVKLLRQLNDEEKKGIELMMGMDPEFLLVDAGKNEVIPASRFLDREGEVGCDAVHGEGFTTYPIAELRPEPREHPRDLLQRLMYTMNAARRMIDDRSLIWQAGGMPMPGLPLGGHLHFSGIVLTAPLLRALDNYLTLPVSLLEAKSSQSRRPKYGYLGDFRRQPHGGFEYRTLPSFLVSPLLTKGVVYLSYLIVLNYKQLKRRPLEDHDRIHQAYYKGERELLKPILGPLLSDIKELNYFSEFSKYIDPLLAHISRGTTWNERRDIRPLWNIPVEP